MTLKRTRALIVLIAGGALALSACAAPTADTGGTGDESDPTQGDPVEITVSTFVPETSLDSKALVAYGDAIEELTDGRITFEYNFAASLHPVGETSQALADGITDLTFFLPLSDPEPAKFPISIWASNLALLEYSTLPAGYYAFSSAQTEWAYQQEALMKEFEDAGIKVLANPVTQARYELLCTTPVTNLAEAAGKRARVAGGVWINEVSALGMVPTQVAGAEQYEALQRGIVDCSTGHPEFYNSSSFYEVAKYYLQAPLAGYNQYYLSYGLDFWNSLTEADQKILWDGMDVWYDTFYGGIADGHFAFFQNAEANGVEILDADDDLLEALEANREETIDNLAATAPPGLDAEAAIQQLRDLNDKWNDELVGLGFHENGDYLEWMEQVEKDGPQDLKPWLDLLLEQVILPSR